MVVKLERRNDGRFKCLFFIQRFDNVQSVTLAKADGEHEFACVQGQKTLMGRGDIIKEIFRNFLLPKMLMFGMNKQC
jgi:hypothetical protein